MEIKKLKKPEVSLQFFEKVLTAQCLFSYLLTPRPLSRGGILTGIEH